jgi:hypothetical protein
MEERRTSLHSDHSSRHRSQAKKRSTAANLQTRLRSRELLQA